MSRRIVYIILCCTALAPLHAQAVWDYSLTEKLAMYDAVETHCRPVYPAAFESISVEKALHLDAEERSQIEMVRQSTQYREVRSGASDELAKLIAASGKDGATKVCKDVIDWD